MNADVATSILSHLFKSPTVGATEERLEALHAIIADVIDYNEREVRDLLMGAGLQGNVADAISQDAAARTNGWVASNYDALGFDL